MMKNLKNCLKFKVFRNKVDKNKNQQMWIKNKQSKK